MTRTILIYLTCGFINAVKGDADGLLLAILEQEISPDCRSRIQLLNDLQNFKICYRDAPEESWPYSEISHMCRGELTECIWTIGSGLYGSDTHRAIENFCFADSVSCLAAFGNKLKDCLSEEKYNVMFENPVHTLKSGKEYLCDNNGERLLALSKNSECFKTENIVQLKNQCEKKIHRERLGMWVTEDFGSEQFCREDKVWHSCIVDSLKTCDDIVKNVFAEYFNILHEKSCENNSGVDWTVNVTFLFCVLSLYFSFV